MKFEIAEKEYELHFGIKFVRQLDELYRVDYQGLEFGMGVNFAFLGLNQYNPATLGDVIRSAVSYEKSPPILKHIDESIESYADEHNGLGELFEIIIDEMGKSSVVKDTLERFKANAKTQSN